MIFDVAAKRADLTPTRRALWFDGRWYDYRELNMRAERLAGSLRQAGVGKGDRVAILAHNHIAHIDLVLATAKLGFIYTPYNHRLSERELSELSAYVRPALMLHDSANHDRAQTAGAASVLRPLDEYEEWLRTSPGAPERPDLDEEDIQMILFTGGTTGIPKGAMLPYRQGFYNTVNTVLSWGLTPEDCAVQATPCFHAALNALTMPLLHLGGRVVLQRAFDAGEYLSLVEQHAATILFMVPTMYAMLHRHPDFEGANLSSVAWAISGGAPCPDPVRKAFAQRDVRFRQGYGLTEAGVNCFAIDLDDAEERPLSVGHPMLHAQAVIRDGRGDPVGPGEVGELTLHGRHLFAGYFEKPEATAEVLRNGWLWTGDLARQDEEGFYYLVGRRKELFISGGENVYPVEIENALYQHEAVSECAVVGVPDDRWGEVGLAAVVLGRSAGTDMKGEEQMREELKSFLRSRLAGYKVPRHLLIVPELPRSGAGKILKRELATMAEELR